MWGKFNENTIKQGITDADTDQTSTCRMVPRVHSAKISLIYITSINQTQH